MESCLKRQWISWWRRGISGFGSFDRKRTSGLWLAVELAGVSFFIVRNEGTCVIKYYTFEMNCYGKFGCSNQGSKGENKNTKARNSLSLTVPIEFGLTNGNIVQPILYPSGNYYEFVKADEADDFLSFNNDILKDIIADKSIPREEIAKVILERKFQKYSKKWLKKQKEPLKL